MSEPQTMRAVGEQLEEMDQIEGMIQKFVIHLLTKGYSNHTIINSLIVTAAHGAAMHTEEENKEILMKMFGENMQAVFDRKKEMGLE